MDTILRTSGDILRAVRASGPRRGAGLSARCPPRTAWLMPMPMPQHSMVQRAGGWLAAGAARDHPALTRRVAGCGWEKRFWRFALPQFAELCAHQQQGLTAPSLQTQRAPQRLLNHPIIKGNRKLSF